jgi:hypothetical protein
MGGGDEVAAVRRRACYVHVQSVLAGLALTVLAFLTPE